MAVAAYASVLSLTRVLDNIQHPSRLRLLPQKTQIQVLKEKLSFLQNMFEVHSTTTISEEMERLVREIPQVTNGAEDVIDRYVVDQLRGGFADQSDDVLGSINTSFCHDLDSVIHKIESISEEMMKMVRVQEKTTHDNNPQRPRVSAHTQTQTSSNEKKAVVGFEDQLDQIMDKLIGNRPGLEILPITGMGGIGKTTLARSAFDHPYNIHHFHERIWLTISQDYRVEDILLGLLNDGVLKRDQEDDGNLTRLTSKLYQKLYGQRYLIVMDDVWSTEAWDDLKWAFPNQGNGSRIIVTTRLLSVADSLGSENSTYSMQFLNEDKSWDLFRGLAFASGGASDELEEIGRAISKSCRGLPLALIVIGGLLANSDMTLDYWQFVAEHVHSFANSADDENCFKILSLSYQHLPIHLKPCFLYARYYPEDSNFMASELIKEWVTQGFVKPVEGKTSEEAAMDHLKDLVDRNMFLIRKRGSTGKIKICGIHDLLRDLCVTESDKEGFLEVPVTQRMTNDFSDVCFLCEAEDTDGSLQLCQVLLGSLSTSHVSPLVCDSCKTIFPQLTELRFVRAVRPQNVPQMTRIRWLSMNNNYSSLATPCTIHLLWNLQILHVNEQPAYDQPVLPIEIWEMPQLRHVKMHVYELPIPAKDLTVLQNLQTLATIDHFKCTEEILTRIPNVKKLKLYYDHNSIRGDEDWSNCHLEDLVRLEKLQSLSVRCAYISLDIKSTVFPLSLKKLTLEKCSIAWDEVTIIGSLPNLEALKLLFRSVVGQEWSPVEEQFPRLKYLKLEKLDLVWWIADETHFPALETLVLEDMKALDTIPQELGLLPCLKSIYLEWSTEKVIDSAKEIVEEQRGNGNDGIVVHVLDFNGWIYQI